MIEFGHGTHPGLQRRHNEDTYQADTRLGLWLVADGMGGHEHGEVASAIARDTICAQIESGHSLADAVHEADQAILSQRKMPSSRLPMGTTVAMLRLAEPGYQVTWVGDSRVYLMEERLRQLSRDHSVVREMVDHGTISEDEAREHPRRNVITQALGITPTDMLEIPYLEGELQPGMQFLLCSDGLSDEVTPDAMESILAQTDITAQECVDQLIVAALEAGGKDNVTVLLVRVRA